MKKLFWITIVIAALAAFFASTNPDGLDFISEKLNFAEKRQEQSAPMPDYSLEFLPEGGISTSLAGIAGILITLAVFWLTVYALKRGANNNTSNKAASFLFLMLVVAYPVFAARPLVTDDYGTVDLGKYELETGYNFITPKAGGGTETGLVAQLKRGMSPSFDFGLELPYNTSAVSGFADMVLHAKIKIREFGEDEGVTARADLKLTNGDAVLGLGSGYLDYGLIMIASKKIADLPAHFNLGYTVIGDPANSTADDTFYYGVALEKALPNDFDLVAEYTGLSSQISVISNLQLGGRYQLNDVFRFDAGCSLALNDNSNNIATIGLTSEF